MRIVIELKRDGVPLVVLNNLFKHTQMQTTFGCNMLALVEGRPRVLELREMLQHFIDFRNQVVVRRTKYELAAAEKRAHILEGFIIALDNIDAVIKTIKESPNVETASERLQSTFKLSEIQAKAILDMRLQRLTGLEREKIQQEYREIIQLIEKLRSILASKDLQLQIISEELTAVEEKYGDERRTDVVFDSRDFTVEDMIANEEVIVTISHKGFIKRTPVNSYRRQGRGGRGLSGAGTYEDDYVENLFRAATHDYLLCFTDKGRVYRVKVYDIPEGSRNAKGRSIANIVQKPADETVTAYLLVQGAFSDEQFIFMCTKQGTVKKTQLSEFESVRSNGKIALSL
ncbi:MAG: DNA gyrase subunit A, partial [Candidatus Kapaibacterium sp.]